MQLQLLYAKLSLPKVSVNYNCDGKPYIWTHAKFDSQLKISVIFFKINFFAYSDKATIKLSLLAVKFHTHSFFYLGDILNYTRPCSSFTMRGTTINLQIG